MRAAATLFLVSLLTATASAATARRDPHAERLRLTGAGMAVASRVDLSSSDLSSGWETVGPTPYGDGSSQCASFSPDFSRFTITGRSHRAFTRGARRIDSSVEVYPSARQARGDFLVGVAHPAAVRRCLAAQVARGLRGTGATYSDLRTSISKARIGDRAVRISVSLRLQAGGNSARVLVDVLAFQRGRVQAALTFTSVGTRLAGELALARTVARRAS